MKKTEFYCFTCDLDIIVYVRDNEHDEQPEWCPFCASEIFYEDEIKEGMGIEDEED